MRGSLALWYERPEGRTAAIKLQIELHFNLWRDLAVSGNNFFDMGILFKPPQQSTDPPDPASVEGEIVPRRRPHARG
jgi:hypothetical protein